MPDNPSYRLYRVSGVRPNGLVVPMGFGLTSDEAERIRVALVEANVFSSIRVEEDTDSGSLHPGTADS